MTKMDNFNFEACNLIYKFNCFTCLCTFQGDDPAAFPEDPKNFAMYGFYNRKALRND